MLRSPSAPAIASIVLAACGATDEADDEHGPGPLPDPASCVPPSYEDAATGNPGPDVAADVGLDKQLFIDDFIVARAAGVTRVPGRVDKLNNAEPVLVANEVWEAPIRVGFYLSVHWDDRIGKFRMWYLAQMPGHSDLTDEHEASHTGVGYAESSDGVTWSKPLVGRRYSELTPGAPDVPTNVVHQGHGFNVLDDPTLPAGHPQKLKAAYDDEHDRRDDGGDLAKAHLAYSSDGIAWTSYNDGVHVIDRAADTANQVLWDDARDTYLMVTRQDLRGDVGEGEARGTRIERRTDNNDIDGDPAGWQPHAILGFTDGCEDEYRLRQIHAALLYPYESVYLAFLYVMEGNDEYDGSESDLVTRHERNIINFYVAPSRNGKVFNLDWAVGGEQNALIPRGPAGAWDKDSVHSVNLVTRGNEHWLFYNGGIERFGHGEGDTLMGIGAAKLRLDGFYGLEAGSGAATVETRPFVLEGGALEVNADASDGTLAIEVLDGGGAARPGFGVDDAVALDGSDGVRLTAAWRSEDLGSLVGETVRLRFHLQSARLYAFQVR